jgi:hypothetical protein
LKPGFASEGGALMPESYRPAREKKIRLNVERMERAGKAERDALTTVRHFNARLSAGETVWAWPKIEAALTSKHHWLSILCESCGTISDMDLRVKRVTWKRPSVLLFATRVVRAALVMVARPSLACRACLGVLVLAAHRSHHG